MTETESKELSIVRESDVLRARVVGKKMAESIGFGEIGMAEIEIAISELGTNIVKHADAPGTITFRPLLANGVRGIEISAQDRGSGIKDVDEVMADGRSSTGTLGIGLSGVRRLMDEFDFESEKGRGTIIRSRKWIKKDYASKVSCSVLSKPKMGEHLSGDTYFFKQLPGFAVFGVIDALGHGREAHEVAEKALHILRNNYQQAIISIIGQCHKGLRNTRGAAMSLSRIDFKFRKFHHVSIGNIETRVYGTSEFFRPICTNGTLGMIMENARVNTYPYHKGNIIVMFSDGISGKFEVESMMLRKTPQEISNHIFSNHARDYDDATVLVVKESVRG